MLALAACTRDPVPPTKPAPVAATPDAAPAPALPAHDTYPDLAAALRATIPADARVLGFGELHARVDRAPVRSALAAFTQALPAIGQRVSDLVLETWLVDPRCGQKAVQATARVETEVKRPASTKSELTLLAEAARAAQIQAHAMTLTCKDYETIGDPVAMLGVTTRELRRIATSAVRHRDREPEHRPWIAVYGGALHNDRFPATTVAEWSYAEAVDEVTAGHYVELDLIVPEYIKDTETWTSLAWYSKYDKGRLGDKAVLFNPRAGSYVLIFPTSSPAP